MGGENGSFIFVPYQFHHFLPVAIEPLRKLNIMADKIRWGCPLFA